jgi:uncharacterized protein YndB with AHSA1/START domain
MTQVDFPTAASSADAASDVLKVNVSRVVHASRERVFNAWTQPEQMRKWMGPVGWQVPELEADARVGGTYRIVYRGTPAPTEQDKNPQERTGASRGTYLEVVPNEVIRYSWVADWAPGEDTVVTIRLSDVDGGTLVELTHEKFKNAEIAKMHGLGWNASMGKLATYLESYSPTTE